MTRFSVAGEHLVDGGGLAGEADAALDLLGSRDDVEPGDARRAGVGPDERREDVDGRRLARAVRPEQGEHRAAATCEVEAVEHLVFAESLAQARGDGERVMERLFFASVYDAKLFMAIHCC